MPLDQSQMDQRTREAQIHRLRKWYNGLDQRDNKRLWEQNQPFPCEECFWADINGHKQSRCIRWIRCIRPDGP